MIIRDKQDLRKCVKQSVRRAPVVETAASAGVLSGRYGVRGWLQAQGEIAGSLQDQFMAYCGGSPFAADPAELLAALDAMDLPVHDLDKAQLRIDGMDHAAYLCGTLDALRARSALIETDLEHIDALGGMDDRFAPLLVANTACFEPGRYGIDYAKSARQLQEAVDALDARHVRLQVFDRDALAYCMLPLCEDTDAVLHVRVQSREQWETLHILLAQHASVRMVVSASEEVEKLIIDEATLMKNVLVRIEAMEHLSYALMRLGTRFIPFASHADTPEEMLGRWIRFKEVLWEAMCDAYLPLARTGYEITSDRIEADVNRLLGGNLLDAWHIE